MNPPDFRPTPPCNGGRADRFVGKTASADDSGWRRGGLRKAISAQGQRANEGRTSSIVGEGCLSGRPGLAVRPGAECDSAQRCLTT